MLATSIDMAEIDVKKRNEYVAVLRKNKMLKNDLSRLKELINRSNDSKNQEHHMKVNLLHVEINV